MSSIYEEIELGEIVEHIRNGLSVNQTKNQNGLPITRIETIWNETIDFERVGYAGIHEGEKDGWLLHNGDILISHINSKSHLGKCALYCGYPERLIHGMNLLCLRPKANKVVPEYLIRVLQSSQFKSKIPNISKDSVNQSSFNITNFIKLKILLPPLPEQKRIAAILDKADAIRRKRQEAIKLADDFLRATFLDMFGDPVTNPKGWPIQPLSKLCDVRDGTHDSPKYVREGFPLITSKNVKNGNLDFSDVSLISESDFLQINKRSAVDVGDIIMPMIGTIGNPVLVETTRKFAIKNVALIKFAKFTISNEYILQLLKSHYFEWIIQRSNRGGTQKFIALEDIRSFPIPVPDENRQQRFSSLYKKLKELKENEDELYSNSSSCFYSLTQRAFRGEL